MGNFLKIIDENSLILTVVKDYSELNYVMRNVNTGLIYLCRSPEDIKFNSFGLSINMQIYSLKPEMLEYPLCKIVEIDEEEYLYLKDIMNKNSTLEGEGSENDPLLEGGGDNIAIEDDSYENYKNSNDSNIMKFTRNSKIKEMSSKCNQSIVKGIDVTLSDDITIEHFDLTITDQINLNSLRYDVTRDDVSQIAFHCKDGEFRYYSKDDIALIIEEMDEHILFHNSYFNSLKKYINSLTDYKEVNSIQYGDDFPDEYKSEILKSFVTTEVTN